MLVSAARGIEVTSNGRAITVRDTIATKASRQANWTRETEITLARETISVSRARSARRASQTLSISWTEGVDVTQIGGAIAI